MQKNIDFVAYMPQETSSWGFIIAGKARKTSEIFNEILEITRKVFDISKGFFIPTKIEYGLVTFSEDILANRLFEHKIKPLGILRRQIQSDKGISYHKFLEEIHSNETFKDKIKYIGDIDIHNGKTKFVLKRKDEYIDRNSKGLYATWGYDEILDEPPTSDPIMIDISHSSLKGENQHVESADPAYYNIVFRTDTDIWFEKTEIGLANRNRLRGVLKKVYENFDVVYTLFLSDWFSEKELKEVVFE
ncbi:hypothetical protein ANME2D_01064 [Candidatus Methanoperedens nitroreducens]|uniref:Uncharacterized protein n=1 Tax=Candidatus Methanoperedens nitratireducens TaxID=1392998 RepID=A0A062V7T2_9EURY|nr:hypothetical protein [Candidatus Methanoperedens nitroreducens]KCZ72633.1 hypothetical protein ANME2D_01064 [Candidatus Methanoperedens nitroreducens]MDJ1423434.1 hypothetical protein [Candidatus Methanoperedens sp.]